MLARREHSRKELARKLGARGFNTEVIDSVLEQLALEGLQSDLRYAESYLNSRIRKGYGPVRITQELRERGIHDDVIENTIHDLDVDWMLQLQEVRTKKFGTEFPSDFKEQARESRFLQYRGFTSEQIRELYRQGPT